MNFKRSTKARVLLFFASLMFGIFVSIGLFHEKLANPANQENTSDRQTALLTEAEKTENPETLFWNPQMK